MNRKAVASELVKVAKSLVAVHTTITDEKSFEAFFRELGLNVTGVKQSRYFAGGIDGRLKEPVDLSVFRFLGTPTKKKISGNTYYKYRLKDGGELSVSDSGYVLFESDEPRVRKQIGSLATVRELVQVAKLLTGYDEDRAEVAKQVLKAVGKLSGVSLEPYKNGRENGCSLVNHKADKQVSFSENRNSDQIVVYFGALLDFDMNNIPSDKTYRGAKYFKPDDIAGAASFIRKHLR